MLTVLAGASTLEQMQDNMRTFQTRKPLTDEERSAIDGAIAALRSVDLIPCTNCGYCVKDCPEGVKIPIAMNLLNLERAVAKLDQKRATSAMEEKQILDRLWEHYELSHSDAQAQRIELESVPKANRRIGELKRDITALAPQTSGPSTSSSG